jgi:CRISPR-associated protein Cas1
MLKRTLYFGNPAYLSKKNEQLVVSLPNVPQGIENAATIPIEDIALVILDHPQIQLSQSLMATLLLHNVALITCDEQHLPTGLLLNLNGHSHQTLHFRNQVAASEILKKQLWQQTVKAKITNQANLLRELQKPAESLVKLASKVKTGDSDNHEAQAAVYYWKNLFADLPSLQHFKREREGLPPNNLFNYGYAILRATVARALVGSGLLPTFGIFHRNQYNAYCLADDIMETYRPFVDRVIVQTVRKKLATCSPEEVAAEGFELDKAMKQILLAIPALDVEINDEKSPLLVAVQRTTASLVRCFEGSVRKISYPIL